MTAVVVVLAFVVAVLALFVVGLLRSHAEILGRLETLQPRVAPAQPARPTPVRTDPVTDIEGLDVRSLEPTSVAVPGVAHDTVVAFLSSRCLTCQTFWDAFAKPRKLKLPAGTQIVVVTKGPDAEDRSAVAELAPSGARTVMSSEAFTAYDVPGSPYFVYVHGPTGQVRGEGTGTDWAQVWSLLQRAATAADPPATTPDADAALKARIDQELYAAGIEPGDPSLSEPN